MTEYIIESAYDFCEDFDEEGDWEFSYTYDHLEQALSKYQDLVNVTGKGLKWRLRKVISETICES